MTAENLIEKFAQKKMVLFVGVDFESEIDKKVCELPWKCIITTCNKPVVPELTKPKFRYTSYSQELDTVLYSDSKDLIQIYGDGNCPDQLLVFENEEIRKKLEIENGNKVFGKLMAKLDARCELIIAGYNPQNDGEMSEIALLSAIGNVKGGSITFLNCNNCSNIFEYSKKQGFTCIENSISSILSDFEETEKIETIEIQENTLIAYKNGRAITVPKDLVTQYESIVQLLTEERVNSIRPSGIIEKSMWFYNFHNNSADSPQWYGYADNSKFYIERYYEREAMELIEKLLDGRIKRNKIVVLEGPSCSSKTIELGAIAYKFFQKKNNPIIYIRGGRNAFYAYGTEVTALEELILAIDDSDSRFLIIWDGSSMKTVLQEAKQLAHILENDKGRRFVLVCSSYKTTDAEDREKPFPQWDSISANDEFYFVKTERKLSDGKDSKGLNEIAEIKNTIAKYVYQVDSYKLQDVYSAIEQSQDIFDYYYRLIELIRPNLVAGSLREQKIVFEFVSKQLQDSIKENIDNINPMEELLRKAGFIPTSNLKDNSKNDSEELYSMEDFCNGVAMFGQFKLSIPYNLALMLLCKGNMKLSNYNLHAALTTYVDFIHYNDSEDGRDSFSFRNRIEAIESLKANNGVPQKQMVLILKMMDYYVKDYKENDDTPDEEIKRAISNIIRMFGPNGEIGEYIDEGELSEVHNYFQHHLDDIIIKLQEIRKEIRNDNDGILTCQEITLVREYYGIQWRTNRGISMSESKPWNGSQAIYFDEHSYKERLEKLFNNSILAQETLQKLDDLVKEERNYNELIRLQNTINNITVELCLTNIQFSEVEKEFKEYCEEQSIECILKNGIKPLPYRIQFEHVFKAIQKNPTNGYLYNTIFKLFELEYNSAKKEEERFELLSDIMLIADDVSTLNVDNRGPKDRDELTMHIAKVYEYAANSDVSIKMIQDPSYKDEFKEVFERLLNQNHAAAICFVCQRELEKIGLSGKAIFEWRKENPDYEFILNDEQLNKCREILEFINDDKYSEAIARTSQAIYLKLIISWMLYNKRPIDTGREWQKTYIEKKQWNEIKDICETYDTCCKGIGRPVVGLLYSLAIINCGERYAEASKNVNQRRDEVGRRQFVTYLICDEKGIPKKYTGKWQRDRNKLFSGWIFVDGIRDTGTGKNIVRCNAKNMGWKSAPKDNESVKFNMGLSYTGAYTAHACVEG